MTGILLCALAFLSCTICAMVNWRIGLSTLIGWGYFFGILKAHYFSSLGHFIFDSATFGFYLGIVFRPPPKKELSQRVEIFPWMVGLIAWPVFVALIPIQHYLVQLVGLRGNIFWLPMMLIGSYVDNKCRSLLAFTLAILNIITFGVAIAEYFLGVELFVPQNEVTKIVYMSNDMAGGSLRIPSTFANAHSYAGAMLQSIPWIIGEFIDRGRYKLGSLILTTGLICALLGVFIAGPRQPVVLLVALVLFAVIMGQVNLRFLLLIILASTVAGFVVSQNERFQRFIELTDTETVSERINVSINLSFVEILADYPMGNGIGAGGTSLPYFVENLLENKVVLENEYARLFLEQGFVGFFLFIGFILWFLTRKIGKRDPARFSKNLIWLYTAITFGTAWVGIGLMTTIPGTFLFFLGIGYCVTPTLERKLDKKKVNQFGNSGLSRDFLDFIPAYQKGLARFG